MEDIVWSVSEFIAVTNQTLEGAYPRVSIVGEVSGFNEWRNQLVFFDLKDEGGVVNCMVPLISLGFQFEEGMQVQIIGKPRLTAKGRFSISVNVVIPHGVGALQRAFELLKKKLENEGLFDDQRKRALPDYPERVAVITAGGSAAWADFQKIAGERWPLAKLLLYDSQVQGAAATNQIVSAIEAVNSAPSLADVLVIIRGGGSLEDLQSFNDEHVLRAVAGSRIPTVSGIGHESDTTLIDYVSDQRASTPTNAAQIVFPDREIAKASLLDAKNNLLSIITQNLNQHRHRIHISLGALERLGGTGRIREQLRSMYTYLRQTEQVKLQQTRVRVHGLHSLLDSLNPKLVLKRGYAIVRVGNQLASTTDVNIGDTLTVELSKKIIKSEVSDVQIRS